MPHHLHPNATVSRHRHATRLVAGVEGRGERAVTAVRSTSRPAAADVLPGPVPRRVRPPRWLDLRLVLGALLVLGSVLLGVRGVAGAVCTLPGRAAAGDLAAGTALTADDLVAVDVRLDGTAD